ncbi:uncharacterized protein LOC134843789 [Symsagittifera roscoffensis]|uniref:uncharacterized protein LOC134843789 n=1 Tax=Symsagittifera roscoffensis TaxID=84072 RepID=UPI00307B54F1
MVDTHGVRPDPDAVEAVLRWKALRTNTQLMSYLDFANFYREFIEGHADKIYPMQQLMRNKGKKFEWNERAQEAFEKIKRVFCVAPLLGMPTEKSMCVLDTDASVKLTRLNIKSLSMLDKTVHVTPEVMQMLDGLLEREVTRDDPDLAAAVASLTLSDKIEDDTHQPDEQNSHLRVIKTYWKPRYRLSDVLRAQRNDLMTSNGKGGSETGYQTKDIWKRIVTQS